MCGIAGGFDLTTDQLKAMVDSLHHRGPDGEGYFEHQNFQMGMRRLAIQDANNGQQPFSSPCGRYHAIFNGEIYNWHELKNELAQHGYHFKTNCDGEILPAAWIEWGESMFTKLNGMFSIAIYDRVENSLILARDHCGQKPLYYSTYGMGFSFASEIKALQAGGLSLSPRKEAFASYLMNRYVSEPETMFNEVRVLPAAHWVKITPDGNIRLKRYWNVPTKDGSLSLSEALERLEGITKSSIQLTHQHDWKSVLYLSSGVDSNLLAKYLSERGGQISSLSIGFESSSDETALATESAKLFGLEHTNIFLNSDSLEELPRVIEQMERPVGDALILAFDALAKTTKQLGAKIAYGAEGIDEHFGGYSFHNACLKAQKLGSVGRTAARTFLKFAPNSIIDGLAKFPASLGPEGKQRVQNYLAQFSILSADYRADYLRLLYEPRQLNSVANTPASLNGKSNSTKWNVNSLLARQYESWLQDWSLIRQDKNSMAHSIEYRCPFLDPALIQFAFSLPDQWKISSSRDKWLWRKLAAQQLPEQMASRPKVPFYLPLEQEKWRKKLISMSYDILSKKALSKHGWINKKEIERLQTATDFLPLKKLAALVIFQLWYDIYFQ